MLVDCCVFGLAFQHVASAGGFQLHVLYTLHDCMELVAMRRCPLLTRIGAVWVIKSLCRGPKRNYWLAQLHPQSWERYVFPIWECIFEVHLLIFFDVHLF